MVLSSGVLEGGSLAEGAKAGKGFLCEEAFSYEVDEFSYSVSCTGAVWFV